MKFSVIVPVYNSEAYLAKCIDSILDQNYDDFELILIDDGSSDSSGDICMAYARKDARVRGLSQENSGPAAARNRGIDLAQGEYVTFVDSDDWVAPDYFRVLERETQAAPDLIFFGRVCSQNDKMQNLVFPAGTVWSHQEVVDYLAAHYLKGDIASCANKVFSRRLLADGTLRFPVGTVVEEDLQFVLGAIDRSESLLSIEDGLYFYNRRDFGSVTTKYNPIKFDSKLRAFRAEMAYADKWNQGRLAEIFDDNFLSYISACINNLMYAACPLSAKQKMAEIRRFYNAEEVSACIQRGGGLSMRSKVMYWLIRLKLYRASYLLHYTIFHLRRR